MYDNAYNANISLGDYFFLQIPTKLGEGTKKSPARIMMTSKWCMENCSCGNFMKHAVCGNILAYTYRHTKLDKECWFGEQYSNLPTEFARNAVREVPQRSKMDVSRIQKRLYLNINLNSFYKLL